MDMNNVWVGACKFCGQCVPGMYTNDMDQEQRDAIATENCDCTQAAAERKIKEQIRKAKEERQTVTLTVPWGFAAWPGDRIAIQRSGWGNSGTFRVREAVVSLNGEQGAATQLTLGTLE